MEHPAGSETTAWRSPLCIACTHFGLDPAFPAVQPKTLANDEADLLCIQHRARMTEGLCVLCGRRAPWMSPFPKSDVGCCQFCYMVLYGAEAAEALEESWQEAA